MRCTRSRKSGVGKSASGDVLLSDLPTYRLADSRLSSDQVALEAVQREIAACALCVEAGFIPVSRPVFHGHVGQRLMIVGQAPGPSAGERPLPYTGATGKTLQRWLERAGFAPGALHHDFYLTSLTKCFPGPATGTAAKGDRPPSAREIALCARHLDREIALVRPQIVIALGRLAAERLDPTARGLPLADLVGGLRQAERAGHVFRLLPLPHPSGVSRWLNDPAHLARLDEALAVLRREVVSRESRVVSRESSAIDGASSSSLPTHRLPDSVR
jgi:uracil-DNA glycosylase family 4